MCKAINSGNYRKIRGFIDAGIDVNKAGKDGMTLTLWAMWNKDIKALELLLEANADPNTHVKDFGTLIGFSASFDDSRYLDLLIQHGGDPNLFNPEKNQSPIFDAIIACNLRNVEVLIKAGADPNLKNVSGVPPLSKAAMLNQYHIVHALLVAGADPNIKDVWGYDFQARLNEAEKSQTWDKENELYKWMLKVADIWSKKGYEVQKKTE